jgi:hypothetical protein
MGESRGHRRLDPPVLSLVDAADASLTVRVCAGASGARGGFTLEWEPGSSGHRHRDRCTAHYSGDARNSPYRLAPNECTEVTFDGLPFRDGHGGWSRCRSGLDPGETYTIRGFAHATDRRKASHWSPPLVAAPPAAAWGPMGTPLPPDAVMVSLEEWNQLAAQDGFQPIVKAELDAAIAATLEQKAAARQLVEGVIAANPALAHLTPVELAPRPGLVRQGDGNYRVNVGGEELVTHGTDWAYGELAASLTLTPSRANQEKHFRSLIGSLPLDQRAGLPDPATLDQVDDAALRAANRELVRRVELYVPNEGIPLTRAGSGGAKRAAWDDPLLESSSLTGCPNHHVLNLFSQYTWPMKQFTTPIRSQGKRGNCLVFSVVAAMEALIFRGKGLLTDYSEQELAAQAYGVWFPAPGDYGEGLNDGFTMDRMIDTAYRVDAEANWLYNRSSQRVDDEDNNVYEDSCVDYESSYCSNTNHQQKSVCTTYLGITTCAYTRPATVIGSGQHPARLTSYVSLWNPFEPENSMAAIRAHLNAGHPVTFAFMTDDHFKDAAARGGKESDRYETAGHVVSADGGLDDSDDNGGHAVLVVGYLANGQIPENSTLQDGAGGGYFIVKNSWGCTGDGGYLYLNYLWFADQAWSAMAVDGTTTTASAPSATVTTSTAALQEYGTFTVGVAVNAATTRVELIENFKGEERTILDEEFAGGEERVFEELEGVVINASYFNGVHLYYARVWDQFGNVATSNTAGVMVSIDDENPEIALQAGASAVVAPGTVTLRADATDAFGIARVKFYRGLQLIGEDATAPYTMAHAVTFADLGAQRYIAIAQDSSGNTRMSNVVDVTVLATPRPLISFSVTPATLPLGGGTVTVSWNVLGASSVSIVPGRAEAEAQGQFFMTVDETTTFVLSATNASGTSTSTVTVLVDEVVQLPPIILAFTASPASLPAGGGDSQLSWAILGPGVTVAIDGIGDLTGQTGVTVHPTETTTYTLRATNAAGSVSRDVAVTVGVDVTAPTVSVAVSSTHVAAAGDLTVTATATDDVGVTLVELLRDGQPFAQGTTATLPLDAGDNGTFEISARAADAAGNSATSVPVVVTVAIDAAPPTVTLAASPTAMTVPGQTLLTATADDDLGVVRVDFHRDGALLASDATPGDGFTATASFAVAGTASFTATAHDAAGNATTSDAVTVTASAAPQPVEGERFVDPATGEDAGNDCSAPASPCRTLAHAIAVGQPHDRVILADGIYDAANQGASEVTIPNERVVRAAHPGEATLRIRLRIAGGIMTVEGLTIDRSGNSVAGVVVSSGFPHLKGCRWKGAFGDGFGALEISGNSSVVLFPGAAGYFDETVAAGMPLIQVGGTALLEINGGSIEGGGVGGAEHAIVVRDEGAVVMSQVTMRVHSRGIRVTDSGALEMNQCTLSPETEDSPGDGILLQGDSTRLALSLTTIDGFDLPGSTAVNLSAGFASMMLMDSTLSGNGRGILIDADGSASIFAGGMSFADNGAGGLLAIGSLELDMRESSLTGNGAFALKLDGNATHGIYVRKTSVAGNHSGLELAGVVGSLFDLGTQDDPGENEIVDNFGSPETAGVVVDIAHGWEVSASGNTWMPDAQGADSTGRYHLGASPCDPVGCLVGGGDGPNYRVFEGSGLLRLAP